MKQNFFEEFEFTCRCGCNQAKMNLDFLSRINSLRETHNKPMNILVGYRCQDAEKSPGCGLHEIHNYGKAVDVMIPNHEDAYELMHAAIAHGFGGIGAMLHGPKTEQWIHLDMCEGTVLIPRPRFWTHSK